MRGMASVQRGQETVEYIVLIILIVVAVITVVNLFQATMAWAVMSVVSDLNSRYEIKRELEMMIFVEGFCWKKNSASCFYSAGSAFPVVDVACLFYVLLC